MCVQIEGGQVKSWQTSLVKNCIGGETQKSTVILARKAVLSVYWCNFRAKITIYSHHPGTTIILIWDLR